jgi:hypothetical protein
MAFGKDPNGKQILSGGTFTQRAAYAGRRPERSGGRGSGSRLYWAENYQPSQYTDTLRLIAAEYEVEELDPINGELTRMYLPWLPIREHYHGGLERGAICSGGPYYATKDKRDLCYGCDMFWEDWAIRKEHKERTGVRVDNPKRVSMQDKFVFGVVDQGTFYKTEQRDKNGNVRTNNSNQPFYEWKKLLYANDPNAVGKETKMGAALPWVMNRGQFDMIQLYSESNIGMSCAGCGTFGSAMQPALQGIRYLCAGCKQPVVDMQTTTLSPLQVAELMKVPYVCQHCSTRAFMVEELACFTCVAKGTEPRRASIFDVDIQVQMQKNPSDPSKQQLVILGYSNPRPIAPQFQALLAPLDLSKFKPTPPAEQAKLWKLGGGQEQQGQHQGQPPPQHAQAPGGQSYYAPYGQGGQQPPPPPPGMPGGMPPGYGTPPGYGGGAGGFPGQPLQPQPTYGQWPGAGTNNPNGTPQG